MQRKTKRFLSVLLCVLLISLLAYPAATAESGEASQPDFSGNGIGTPDGTEGMQGPSGMNGGTESVSHYPEAAAYFEQYEYTDPDTGYTIPYNLYLPDGYNGDTQYPLVVYIADAGVNSDTVTDPLDEDGAAVWATDGEQAKHPAIVLVPQYTNTLISAIGGLVEDDYLWSDGLTLVSDLIFHIIDTYSVDTDRIYATGQSQGGMTAIAVSDKYPDLYAGVLLVACQWNTEEMAVLKDNNIWIVVCEGDSKAYPGMNDAVAVWESLGTTVATSDMWDSTVSADEFAALVASMRSQGCNINYTVLEGGNHTYTWSVAYTIEGIRDWLFEQTK